MLVLATAIRRQAAALGASGGGLAAIVPSLVPEALPGLPTTRDRNVPGVACSPLKSARGRRAIPG